MDGWPVMHAGMPVRASLMPRCCVRAAWQTKPLSAWNVCCCAVDHAALHTRTQLATSKSFFHSFSRRHSFTCEERRRKKSGHCCGDFCEKSEFKIPHTEISENPRRVQRGRDFCVGRGLAKCVSSCGKFLYNAQVQNNMLLERFSASCLGLGVTDCLLFSKNLLPSNFKSSLNEVGFCIASFLSRLKMFTLKLPIFLSKQLSFGL
jgi:hypothetical protein